jgi:hypothetical protein
MFNVDLEQVFIVYRGALQVFHPVVSRGPPLHGEIFVEKSGKGYFDGRLSETQLSYTPMGICMWLPERKICLNRAKKVGRRVITIKMVVRCKDYFQSVYVFHCFISTPVRCINHIYVGVCNNTD